MASKTIRVNLTLNDDGFTTKVQDANGKIAELNRVFKGAAKAAEGMESNLSKVKESTKGVNTAVSGFAKAFEGMKSSMLRMGESARDMRKDLNSISTNTEAVVGKFRSLSSSAGTLGRSFASINSSAAGVVSNMTRLDAASARAIKLIRDMGAQARTAATDMKKLQTSVASMNTSAAGIEAAIARANRAIVDFTQHMRQMNAVAASVGTAQSSMARSVDRVGGGFHNWIWTLGMAREAAFTLFDVFLRAPIGIIQTNAQLERMQMLFQGMSDQQTRAGRVEDGKATKNAIVDMALNAPFDVKTLMDGAVKLKSGGIDPLNGSLKTLADSVAFFGGTSDQFHRASIAIQQMAGKGVVSMEELRQQLGEAVPTAMQAMATGMGMTMAELTDKVSKGQVEAKTALAKMLAQMDLEMGGAAQRMMQTWSGMWEGFKTRMVIFSEQIGNADFFQTMRGELSILLAAMDRGAVEGFATAIGQGLNTVVTELRDVLTRAQPLLQAMLNAMQAAGGVLAVAWGAFKELVSVLAELEDSLGLVTAAMTAWLALAVAGRISGMVQGIGQLVTQYAALGVATQAQTAAQAVSNATTAAGTVQTTALGAAMARTAAMSAGVVTGITTIRNALIGLTVSGGPIVILIGLLTAAISAWMEFARRGEEAAARVRAAAQGNAPGWKSGDEWKRDVEDLNKSRVATLDAKKKLDDATKQYKAAVATGVKGESLANFKQVMDNRALEYKKLADTHLTAVKAYNANNKKYWGDKAKEDAQRFQAQYDAGTEDYSNKIRRSQRAFEESKEGQAMKPEQRAKKFAEIEATATTAYIEALNRALAKAKTQTEKDIILKKIEDVTKRSGNYQTLVGQTPNKFVAGKKDGKKDGDATIQDDRNPLVDAIEKAKVDVAIAETELSALGSDMTKVAKLQQEAELKVKRMFLGGDMDKAINMANGETENKTLSIEQRKAGYEKLGAQLTKLVVQQATYEAQAKAMKTVDDAQAKAVTDLALAQAEFNGEIGKNDPIAKFIEAMAQQRTETQLAGKALEDFNAKAAETARLMASADLLRKTKALRDQNKETAANGILDSGERERVLFEQRQAKIREEADSLLKKRKAEGASEGELAGYKAEIERQLALGSEEYAYKAKGALGELLKSWQDVSGQMGQVAADFTSGFADELTNLVVDGKGSFADLAESMVKQIIKINLQLLITKALMAMTGMASPTPAPSTDAMRTSMFAKGGAFNSGNLVRAFATGGAFTNSITTGPNLAPMALFGEAGPEAIMPLVETSGGLGVRAILPEGGGRMAMPDIQINFINQTGQQMDAEAGKPRFDGRKMILDVVASAVSTPGSFRETMRGAMA